MQITSCPRMHRGLTKTLMVMKLTTMLLLVFILQANARTSAQQTITYSGKDIPMEKMFSVIREQTGYKFFYDKTDLAGSHLVTVDLVKANLEAALEKIFDAQPVMYTIRDKTIFIRKKESAGAQQLDAPPIDVQGRVVDEDGNPLEGVTVQVKGSERMTLTNAHGQFELSGVDDKATLVLSGVSIETRELKVNKNISRVVVKKRISPLDEVQIIAYGQTTKRFQTGNVTSIKASEIEKQPVLNPLLALQGRVPGLTISQSTGIAGGSVVTRIQGRNNLNSNFTGSDPLIIIDGVPYVNQNPLTFESGIGSPVLGDKSGQFQASGSTLSFINPSDIESIDVLKDADATAIYGSRAANGAILITTKKGKQGDVKLNLNIQTGWSEVAKKFDFLNTQQYLEMRHEGKENDNEPLLPTDYDLNGLWDSTRYTDWQDVLIGGKAKFTRLTSSISGGTADFNYLIGASYAKEGSVFPSDYGNTQGSVHFNINSTAIGNRLRVQLTGSYLSGDNNQPGIDYTQSIILAPLAPKLYNEDGSLNWAPDESGNSTWENPLSNTQSIFEIKSSNLIANAIVGYKMFPSLEFKASLGYNQLQTNQFLAALDGFFKPERLPTLFRSATFTGNASTTWIAEPQIEFKRPLGKYGRLILLAGATFQENQTDGNAMTVLGHSSDQLLRNRTAGSFNFSSNANALYRYSALFGRLNYIHREKYILNLSARRDGSSRFGSNNKFNTFAAGALGWIFSEEKFFGFAKPILSFGKLRISYGMAGNDQIGDYTFMSLFNSTFNTIPYQNIRGLQSSGINNPNLQWEETKKLQAGLEFGIANDKILLTINYFNNRSSNTLSTVKLPFIAGTNGYTTNFPALIENKGFEIVATSENIRSKSFTWATSFNLTFPSNRLLSFPDLETSLSSADLIIGQPLSVAKDYDFVGVDPATGYYSLRDKTGNATTVPNFDLDRISVINTNERFYGGLQNSLRFKSFTLDFLFHFSAQNAYSYLSVGIPGSFNYTLGNQPVDVMDRWQKPGDISNTARFTASTSAYPIQGDRAFKDAMFARLKNLSLTYGFSDDFVRKVRIQDAKIFLSAQNVFTLTKYKGLDPETKSLSTLPPLRVITFGCQLTL